MVEFTLGELRVLQQVIEIKRQGRGFTFEGLTDQVLALCGGERNVARQLARDMGGRIRASVENAEDGRLRIQFSRRDPERRPEVNKSNAIKYRKIE